MRAEEHYVKDVKDSTEEKL